MCSQQGYLKRGVMLFSRNKVKELPNVGERTQAGFQAGNKPTVERTRWLTLLAVPVAVAIALALHWFAAKKEPPGETLLYTCFLSGLLFAAVLAVALHPLWSGLRDWARTSGPLIAVAVVICPLSSHPSRLLVLLSPSPHSRHPPCCLLPVLSPLPCRPTSRGSWQWRGWVRVREASLSVVNQYLINFLLVKMK